ncbi:MAG: peptidase S16 [Methanomicrobiales archaeon]|nr:peptidase S16 [Methanomicrobiales archaeon]
MSHQPITTGTKILILLLIVSFLGNGYLALLTLSPKEQSVETMQSTINSLDARVMELTSQLEDTNITLRNYASQLDTYRQMVADLREQLNATSTTLQGYATLQGPAVLQRTETIRDGPVLTQQTVTEGAMIDISVEIRPGEGRVLVHTTPLMGIVFQDTANTAVFVAQNITGKHFAGSDVIFSVEAQDQVPAVDGPSAGALMTALVIAALENQTPRQDITLTGTIDPQGHVGAIGGILEKSQAAKASGKSIILLPRENARLVQYTETTRRVGGFTFVQRVPKVVDAKEYLESEVGITVTYVDSIRDVEQYLGLGTG